MLTGNDILRRPSFEEKYRARASPDVVTPAGSSRSDSPSVCHQTPADVTDPPAAASVVCRTTSASVVSRHTAELKYRARASPDVVTPAGSSRSDSPSVCHQTPTDVTDPPPAASVVCNASVVSRHTADLTQWGPVSRLTNVISRDTDSVLQTAGRPFVAVTSRTCSASVASSRPVSGPHRQFITCPPAPAVAVSPHSLRTSAPHTLPSASPTPRDIPLSTTHTATVPTAEGVSCVMTTRSVSPPEGVQIAVATSLPPVQLGFATSPQRDSVTLSRSTALTSTAVTATSWASRPPTTVVLQQVHSCEVAWPSAQRATAPCSDSAASSESSSLSDITGTLPEALAPTLPEKPPPPYPGRAPISSPRALRPAPPPPPETGNDVTPACTSDGDDVYLSSQSGALSLGQETDRDNYISTQDIDSEQGPAADDSSDEDVAMTTECQRIESPRPVRRAGSNHCETKVTN